MTARELDAAGINDPVLRHAYARCRELNARHGKTYFLATRLLPVERRPAVHALYGFARRADDIVDDLGSGATTAQRAAALHALQKNLDDALRDGSGDDPVVTALAHTSARYGVDHRLFTDFMASMRCDLEVTDYASYDELCAYMHGSAAVIGLQMLPVLGTVVPRKEAAPHAAALGRAFQLTNFLRDVGEDLDRGRVYLPGDVLAAHGVDRDLLQWSRASGTRDPRITSAVKALAALTRRVYGEAAPGIAILDPVTRPCIRTAFVLYGAILDAVRDDGYSVLHRRSVVPGRRRAAVAVDGLARLAVARARAAAVPPTPASTARGASSATPTRRTRPTRQERTWAGRPSKETA